MDKIDELIKNEISIEIRSLFPDKIISVTQAHVSKDLSYAKIWLSSVNDLEKIVKECQKRNREIKNDLAGKVKLRRMPNLHFVADNTEIEADKIEKLIKEIKE